MFEKHPDSFSNLTYNLIYQPTPVIERYIAAIIIYQYEDVIDSKLILILEKLSLNR